MPEHQISERGRAMIIAAAVLDRSSSADPDDDLAVLARQLNRANEEVERLRKRPEPVTVTQQNAKDEIERCMSDLVDLLALFVTTEIDPRAWSRLLIYAPKDL